MKTFHLILAIILSTTLHAQDSINIIVSNRVNFETDANKK